MTVYASVDEYLNMRNQKIKRYPARGRGRPAKYPWKNTAVGASFFVPNMLSCITHTTAEDVVFRDFKKLEAYQLGAKGVKNSKWSMSNRYDVDGNPVGVMVTRVA